MRLTVLFCLIFLSVSAYCDDCKNVKCKAVPKHYEEFGCEPKIPSGKCCPSHFDCSAIENRDATKCYYKSESFNIGEQFNGTDSKLEESCTVGCYCRESFEAKSAKFECAHIDCPEFFGTPPQVLGKKCINQYEESSCCLTKTVCGEDLNKLARCEVNGKTYYEGEKIDTSRSCYSCLCGKGYENKPFEDNKHCHKINCHMEIHYSERISDGCIPIYYKTDDCCPIDWRCPDNKTTVIPDSSRKVLENDPSLKCSFGKLNMNIGDFLSPANDYDQCTLCSCKIPPFAHCIKTC